MTTPSRAPRHAARRRAATRGVIIALAIVALVAALVVPADAVQGQAQRLMYLHVPSAWTAYLAFGVVLVASGIYLRGFALRAAAMARAAAEIGIVLTGLTLVSGMVWGALTWGTPWVWDGRTTSTVAMGLVYVIYLAARGLETGRRSRLAAAWIGIVGFVSVPVVHLSVLWWRTLHQPPTLLAPSVTPPMHPLMGLTLALSVLAATLLVVAAIRRRAASIARPSREPRLRRRDPAPAGASEVDPERARG